MKPSEGLHSESDGEPTPSQRPSFSDFGWILAESLRMTGRVMAGWLTRAFPDTTFIRLQRDRLLHLNEALGYFIPRLTAVLSLKRVGENSFVFRPFTDDVDKISQDYEPIVRRLIAPRASEVIVDIGANIGCHTLWLSKCVGPSGLIIAVEPEHNNFLILNLNRRINNLENILSVRTALGSSSMPGELHVPRPTLMGQVGTKISDRSSRSYFISVDIETLDDVISNRRIESISTIKVDVEGAEMSVLQGAKKTINRFRPRIVVETHGHTKLECLRALLESLNMKISWVERATSRPDEDRHFVLATPKS